VILVCLPVCLLLALVACFENADSAAMLRPDGPGTRPDPSGPDGPLVWFWQQLWLQDTVFSGPTAWCRG